jgi:diadenosine tetraphosphate (Ap4A) HIT family hydrolase
VEHAYPVKRVGWLVIVLKRHAEALHDLSAEEFAELGRLQSLATRFLFGELHNQKEYISCYGEAEGFVHIHFHVFAKPADLAEELKGGKSFGLLKVSREQAVPPGEIIAFCETLQNKFNQQGM